jgi:hypothetical protein
MVQLECACETFLQSQILWRNSFFVALGTECGVWLLMHHFGVWFCSGSGESKA